MKKSYIAAEIIAFTAFSTTAFAKDAKCKIIWDDTLVYNQVCKFEAWGNDGSFILSSKNPNRLLFQDNKTLWVRVSQKNVAELGTDLSNGHSQRWGVTLIRSQRDRACWDNEAGDVSICVYAK